MSHRDPTPAPLKWQPEYLLAPPGGKSIYLSVWPLEPPERILRSIIPENHTPVGPRVWELGFIISARKRLWPPAEFFGTKKMFFFRCPHGPPGRWRVGLAIRGTISPRGENNIFVSYCIMSRSQKDSSRSRISHSSTTLSVFGVRHRPVSWGLYQLAFGFHETKSTTFTAFFFCVIWSGWSSTHLTVCYIWLIEDFAVETRGAMLPQAWRSAPTLRFDVISTSAGPPKRSSSLVLAKNTFLQYLANLESYRVSDYIFHFLPHISGAYRPILFVSTMIAFSTSAGPPERVTRSTTSQIVFLSRLPYVLSHFWRHFRHRPVTLNGHPASTSRHFLLTITFDTLLGLTSG